MTVLAACLACIDLSGPIHQSLIKLKDGHSSAEELGNKVLSPGTYSLTYLIQREAPLAHMQPSEAFQETHPSLELLTL